MVLCELFITEQITKSSDKKLGVRQKLLLTSERQCCPLCHASSARTRRKVQSSDDEEVWPDG